MIISHFCGVPRRHVAVVTLLTEQQTQKYYRPEASFWLNEDSFSPFSLRLKSLLNYEGISQQDDAGVILAVIDEKELRWETEKNRVMTERHVVGPYGQKSYFDLVRPALVFMGVNI